jgi:catechol 2,3-dioxygenase-like lactoylglutathione lyase family enzyme
MNRNIFGIHYVTAITRDPQKNSNFYTNDLGLRFVKLTVNIFFIFSHLRGISI